MRIASVTTCTILALSTAPSTSSGQPAPASVETTTTTDTSSPTPAAPGPWSIGIAPRFAVTVPTSKLGPMILGGLGVDFVLPVAERRLLLSIDATLTRPSYDGSGSDPRVNGAYSYEVKETELKLGLDAVFRFFTADKAFVPYVGAGPVIHLLRTTETTSFAPDENMEQSTKLGFELLAGADYRLGPGMLLAELRLVYSNLDHLFTGDTNAGNVSIGVGYRVVF